MSTAARKPTIYAFSTAPGKSAIAVLRVDGKKVTLVGYVEVGGLPEGLAFTPDGKYLLVGNYIDQDISILKVDGMTVTNTGKRFKLPGHPASVGMSKQ